MTLLMAEILGVWVLALLAGVPLFATMGLAAFAFVAFGGLSMSIVPQKLAQSVNSFPLLAAPLFILMGNIMNSAGITERIFTFATACVGWLRGGLCHANILGSVIFAGMSGSAVADAGGIGTLEIKAMRDEGYDPDTAAAITAASATIGPIIPPSLPMVIYGVSADVSIGGLFLAGVVPGLLMAVALMLMVARSRAQTKHAAPSVPGPREFMIALQARVLGADDAGDPVRRHDERHLHADRGRRHRDRLRADPRPVRLSRLRPAHAAEADRRHRRDHRRGAVAGDDRGRARLVPVGVAHPADRRADAAASSGTRCCICWWSTCCCCSSAASWKPSPRC